MTQAAMRARRLCWRALRRGRKRRGLQTCEANRLPSAAGERRVGSVKTPSERARTCGGSRASGVGRVSAAAAESACPSPTVQNEEQMGRIAARRDFRLYFGCASWPRGPRGAYVEPGASSSRSRLPPSSPPSPTPAPPSPSLPPLSPVLRRRDAHSVCHDSRRMVLGARHPGSTEAAPAAAPAAECSKCTFVRFC
jgi:hypothetical protein